MNGIRLVKSPPFRALRLDDLFRGPFGAINRAERRPRLDPLYFTLNLMVYE